MKSLREVVVTRGELAKVPSDASDGHFASDGHPECPLWIRIGSELQTVVVQDELMLSGELLQIICGVFT